MPAQEVAPKMSFYSCSHFSFCSEGPNNQPRRWRQKLPTAASAAASASHLRPERACARDWFERLPDCPCKVAVADFCEEARRGGVSMEEAMLQGLAYAQRLWPEEVVLWSLDRGLVPDPWHDESLQRGIRSSLLALRH